MLTWPINRQCVEQCQCFDVYATARSGLGQFLFSFFLIKFFQWRTAPHFFNVFFYKVIGVQMALVGLKSISLRIGVLQVLQGVKM